MKKRIRTYKPKTFESTTNTSDTSANIYVSMLLSESWQQLTKNAQILYVYCKAQYYAEKKKPKPIISHLTSEQQSKCFTMNKTKWLDLYKIYKSDNGQFNKDIKQLIQFGFIELVECGKFTRTKNIYMLSDKWQQNN